MFQQDVPKLSGVTVWTKIFAQGRQFRTKTVEVDILVQDISVKFYESSSNGSAGFALKGTLLGHIAFS